MDEYIERQEAIEAAKHAWAKGLDPSQYIEIIPSADVAQVRHGWWIPEEHEDRVSPTMTHRYRWYHCSLCGRRLIGYSNPKDAPYCHCGAKMDGGGDHA